MEIRSAECIISFGNILNGFFSSAFIFVMKVYNTEQHILYVLMFSLVV